MPVFTDELVVASGYNTIGDGRKTVRTANGDFYFAVLNGTSDFRIYKRLSGQTTSSLLATVTNANTKDVHIEDVGNGNIGLVYVVAGTVYYRAMNGLTGALTTAQSMGGSSSGTVNSIGAVVNATKTTIHVTWTGVVDTYTQRLTYRTGIISSDGTITLGIVDYVAPTSTDVSGRSFTSISISLHNDVPVIAAVGTFGFTSGNIGGTTNNNLLFFRRDRTLPNTGTQINTSWSGSYIYNNSTGTNYNVDKVSLGVDAASGKIWVSYHGRDITDTSVDNIRVSSSTDGGITFAAITKLTSGNTVQRNKPTLSVSSNGKVFINYTDNAASVYQLKWDGVSWGTPVFKAAGTDPSSPEHLNSTITDGVFIYKGTSKVGFFGSWGVPPTVTAGSNLGNKDLKDSLVTYTYSQGEGSMIQLVEKLNGSIITNISNPVAGSRTISLTQSQWDSIKYDNGHTLVVEVTDANGEKTTSTFTFNKRLATNDDLTSAVKGVKDLETYIQNVKTALVSSTGQSSANTLMYLAQNAGAGLSGTVTSSSSNSSFTYVSGTTVSLPSVTVTGLSGKPKFIYLFRNTGSAVEIITYSELSGDLYPKTIKIITGIGTSTVSGTTYHIKGDVSPVNVVNGSFVLPVATASSLYTWIIM